MPDEPKQPMTREQRLLMWEKLQTKIQVSQDRCGAAMGKMAPTLLATYDHQMELLKLMMAGDPCPQGMSNERASVVGLLACYGLTQIMIDYIGRQISELQDPQ